MRFEEGYGGRQEGRLTQEEAARLLGLCRSLRRYIDRYEEAGLEGLIDKGLSQVSQRRAAGGRGIGLDGALPPSAGGLERQHPTRRFNYNRYLLEGGISAHCIGR